jgi:fatty acid synthase subunit alpha
LHRTDTSIRVPITSSITGLLCEQLFRSPIHWTKALNFLETATHVVDFGPSGLNGIGFLIARNFDGHGVHVIVADEKCQGDAAIYGSTGVKYDKWYSKKMVAQFDSH